MYIYTLYFYFEYKKLWELINFRNSNIVAAAICLLLCYIGFLPVKFFIGPNIVGIAGTDEDINNLTESFPLSLC